MNKDLLMKKILIFLTILILFTPFYANSQNKKIDKAQELYKAGEYLRALNLYTKIYPKLKDKEDKGLVSFYAGMCERNLLNPQGAILWYRKAFLYKYQDPLVNLYLADAFKMKGQYDNAKEYFANYRDLVPNDPRADDGIKSCDLAVEWMANPNRYIVSLVSSINSRENDFAPAISKDTNKLFFTSTRTTGSGTKINYNSGESFADIFVTVKDIKGSWTEPVPLPGAANSQFDDGSCSLEPDGRTIYFTQCPVIQDKNAGCKIFKSTFSDEQWSAAEIVPTFSDTAVSCGQPFLAPDGLTLYFVSDNPKGIGGKDIWYMTRNSASAKWGSPQLMSSDINTKYDELYPAMDFNGNFYFSTDGRIGMGGLDIFKATKSKDGSYKVENLQFPMNSSGNDFGIVFNPFTKSGYFSSSRIYAKGDDIYQFYIKPLDLTLKGYVINDVNHAYLPDVDVEITGSDGSKKTVKTTDQGMFTIKLHENIDYIIVTSKKNFLKATGSISTKGIVEDGKVFETEIYMKPSVGYVKIPNIRYDFADTTLRDESKIALDELIDILKINPTIVIELSANTDFRGSDKNNLKLSQGRANSVVAYLVAHGVKKQRLVAKGNGESKPLEVDELSAQKYPFLKAGDVLSESFILKLPTTEEQEICHELNRRTEFRVLRSDYIDNFEKFGD